VKFFVEAEELVPAVVDDLPEWRGTGAAGLSQLVKRKSSGT